MYGLSRCQQLTVDTKGMVMHGKNGIRLMRIIKGKSKAGPAASTWGQIHTQGTFFFSVKIRCQFFYSAITES